MKQHLFLFFIFLSFSIKAQTDQEEISRNKALAEENRLKQKSALLAKLDDLKGEYDEGIFGIAIGTIDYQNLTEYDDRYKKQQKPLQEIVGLLMAEKNATTEDGLSLNMAGQLLLANHKFTMAEAAFKSALRILLQRGQGRTANYAAVLNNMGILYNLTARYSLAEGYYDKALTMKKELFPLESSQMAASYNNMALLYKDISNYTDAHELSEEAVRINEKALTKKSLPYAISLNNKSLILMASKKYEEAEPLLIQAISIAADLLKENSDNYTLLLINLARLYQQMGKYPEAEVMFLKALRTKEKNLGSGHADNALLHTQLAALYLKMDAKKGQVEGLLKKSLSIAKKQFGEKHPDYAAAASNMGNYYRMEGRLVEAKPLLEKALQIRGQALGIHHPEYITSLESMGILLWQSNRIKDAIPYMQKMTEETAAEIYTYFPTMNDIEKERFLNKCKLRFEHYKSFVLLHSQEKPSLTADLFNYDILSKSLSINAISKLRKKLLKSTDQAVVIKFKEWLDKKEQMARGYQMSLEQQKQENINTDSIQRINEGIEKFLAGRTLYFQQAYIIKKVILQDLRSQLQPDEALINFIRIRKFNKSLTDSSAYAALILTKEQPNHPHMVVYSNGDALETKEYVTYKTNIRQKTDETNTYHQYWSLLEKYLTGKKHIYIAADGIFNQVNLNTIRLPKDGYLIDSKRLVMITNAADLLHLKTKKHGHLPNRALILAYPEYGSRGTIYRLPGTKIEAESLQTLFSENSFKTIMLLQAKATEQELKKMYSCKILHLATHCFFKPELQVGLSDVMAGDADNNSEKDPVTKSGLYLAGAEKSLTGDAEDGVLTNDEIMGLQLDSTELVVLSASEVGVSDANNGNGLYGLQRAFIIAGARSILLSLWKVNDAISQEFLLNYYRLFINMGNPRRAYSGAIDGLRKKYSHPYYWGAFTFLE